MKAADKTPIRIERYTVEVCPHADPDDEAPRISGVRVQSIKFTVELDPKRGPVLPDRGAQIKEWHYDAARTAMGVIAGGTDWPAGTYLVIVEQQPLSSAYVSRLGEHREFNLSTAKGADWAY